jgi:hypothetical protein
MWLSIVLNNFLGKLWPAESSTYWVRALHEHRFWRPYVFLDDARASEESFLQLMSQMMLPLLDELSGVVESHFLAVTAAASRVDCRLYQGKM